MKNRLLVLVVLVAVLILPQTGCIESKAKTPTVPIVTVTDEQQNARIVAFEAKISALESKVAVAESKLTVLNVPQVTKAEFDALKAELTATKADLVLEKAKITALEAWKAGQTTTTIPVPTGQVVFSFAEGSKLLVYSTSTTSSTPYGAFGVKVTNGTAEYRYATATVTFSCINPASANVSTWAPTMTVWGGYITTPITGIGIPTAAAASQVIFITQPKIAVAPGQTITINMVLDLRSFYPAQWEGTVSGTSSTTW